MTIRAELEGETVIPSQGSSAHLRLDPGGFTGVSSRGKEKRLAWTAVTGFKPVNVGTTAPSGGRSNIFQVGFFLADPPKKGRVSRWICRRFYKVDDTLPGGYPDIEEIVALMERWRQRHGRRES